jgi:hypothetical protein
MQPFKEQGASKVDNGMLSDHHSECWFFGTYAYRASSHTPVLRQPRGSPTPNPATGTGTGTGTGTNP